VEQGKKIEPGDLGLVSSAPRGAVVQVVQPAAAVLVPNLDALTAEPAPKNSNIGRPIPFEELERQHILEVLRGAGGNRTQAATILKISIRTMRNKLNEYKLAGLVPDDVAEDESAAPV
jgi:DNA-binding NtrC family response regulator